MRGERRREAATACPDDSASDLGVAVCLLGFVRTLSQQPVYESLSTHFRSHGHADFFGVVSSGGDDTAKGQWDDVKPQTLEAALSTLRPIAWEDTYETRGPRCGLLCMRQYDRMQRCTELIEAREQLCGRRYAWVVKARPDVTIRSAGRPLEAEGMRSDGGVVYKDRRAGDMVNYVPRRLWTNVSRVLSSTPCAEVRRHGVDCSHAAAATGGGNCKCNVWLSVGVARVLGLKLAYHRFAVQVVRTSAALELIADSRRQYGGDGMRALHNKSRAPIDLRHLRGGSTRASAKLAMLATVVSVANGTDAGGTPAPAAADVDVDRFRASADVMLLPYVCCNNMRALAKCRKLLLPTDPPLLLMLNKVFENLPQKLMWIKAVATPPRNATSATRSSQRGAAAKRDAAHAAHAAHPNGIAVVVTATPHAAEYEAATGVRTRYLPYAAAEAFGTHADGGVGEYAFDVGFSGGNQMFSSRYPLRSHLMALRDPRKIKNRTTYQPSAREMLEAYGYKLGVWGWLATSDYIRRLSLTKVWFATTESGEHVGTRFYEVMMSGRAMLLCNRAPDAYAPIGLIEGVHMAAFNSSDEFISQVLYYLEHEDERRRIVANARRFVRNHHSWHQRASDLVAHIREALGHPSKHA